MLGPWHLLEEERLISAVSEVGKAKTPELAALSSGSGLDETRCVPVVSPKMESGTTGSISADIASNETESVETESTETESGSGTWEQVANLVMTRNQGQCRSKWLFHLEWKERRGEGQINGPRRMTCTCWRACYSWLGMEGKMGKWRTKTVWTGQSYVKDGRVPGRAISYIKSGMSSKDSTKIFVQLLPR